VLLVGVDERQVERPGPAAGEPLGRERRQGVERVAHAHVHHAAQPRPGHVSAGDRGIRWIGFERDHAPALGQPAGEPDRAVAAERADLEHRARALQPGEQHEQLALSRRHLVRRQAGRSTGRERRVEGGVGRHE
jgi:hypothetical protein